MEIQNLREHFGEEIEFPTDLETVLDEVGETEIDAPNSDASMTISDILGHLDEGSYETPGELREIVLANVPDEYVGRENYSDRGPEANRPAAGSSQRDDQESL
jgi:hypothetical protein